MVIIDFYFFLTNKCLWEENILNVGSYKCKYLFRLCTTKTIYDDGVIL